MSDGDDNAMDTFVHEGLARYRQAGATLVAFGEEVERRLQKLLTEGPKDGWGRFVPASDARARSTRYWSKYPLLNAKLDGKIDGADATITLAVNWWEAEGDYPFYALHIEPTANHIDAIRDFDWQNDIKPAREGIVYEPNPEILDLQEGFRRLLDEAGRFLT
mgnify:CR=1 FL=1